MNSQARENFMCSSLYLSHRVSPEMIRDRVRSRCSVLRPNGSAAAEDHSSCHFVTTYSDPLLLALASLANGPKDAAAMIDDIATLCGMRLDAKTIYGAINQLQQRRWIEPRSSAKVEHRYRLTITGLHAFRASLAALRQFSQSTVQTQEAI
jgi:hypothetical protein